MGIQKIIRKGLKKALGLAGYDVFLCPKAKKTDMLLFDRNTLSSFYNRDKRVKLYYEGLQRVNLGWSDNFSKQCRFYSLQQLVEYAINKELDGEFAECGCWKGHSTYIISRILSENSLKKTFYVFDSFEGGLSDKSREDENERLNLTREQIEIEKKAFASTEEEVRHALLDFPFVKLYRGWIPQRFNEVAGVKFSFVHIDVDLYQPTLDSLEFFYPRLSRGGCVVLDDYGFTQFPGCKKAVDLFLSKNKFSFFYEHPIGGCFILK